MYCPPAFTEFSGWLLESLQDAFWVDTRVCCILILDADVVAPCVYVYVYVYVLVCVCVCVCICVCVCV
jgi:hypothetical protein